MAASLAGVFAPTVLSHPVNKQLVAPYIPADVSSASSSACSRSPSTSRSRTTRTVSIGALFRSAKCARPARPLRPFCPYELVQSVCPIPRSDRKLEAFSMFFLGPQRRMTAKEWQVTHLLSFLFVQCQVCGGVDNTWAIS